MAQDVTILGVERTPHENLRASNRKDSTPGIIIEEVAGWDRTETRSNELGQYMEHYFAERRYLPAR